MILLGRYVGPFNRICYKFHLDCNDGDIRLRDGYVGGNDKDGRVEICLNNTWGSLCSDSWDFEDASVACRQLGYSYESKRSM